MQRLEEWSTSGVCVVFLDDHGVHQRSVVAVHLVGRKVLWGPWWIGLVFYSAAVRKKALVWVKVFVLGRSREVRDIQELGRSSLERKDMETEISTRQRVRAPWTKENGGGCLREQVETSPLWIETLIRRPWRVSSSTLYPISNNLCEPAWTQNVGDKHPYDLKALDEVAENRYLVVWCWAFNEDAFFTSAMYNRNQLAFPRLE